MPWAVAVGLRFPPLTFEYDGGISPYQGATGEQTKISDASG